MRVWLIAIFLLVANASTLRGQSLVAETAPLLPEEQLSKFHLPPGFEIQLVASEPDIHKPMNLKFDARGRLWVSHSLEYPFPAAGDAAARDSIRILSDLSSAGKATKIQEFADHLNIPVGLLPLGDREAIAWSIPNVYRLVDSDGDGRADRKTIAWGPYGVTDTHGNQNAFTRWVDGWIYANHGFNNDSHIKKEGQGDQVLHLQSGNTYRFRPDGSAIEQFSWGQVNPFGLSFDALGNLYSADCHSSAVTMLLRGGYYHSFGKPHDGLGFAPVMTNADHGGTGIAGVAYSAAPNFPLGFRDVLFIGNVITNRIHCDRLKWSGSTPVVDQIEDFIVCDDPLFRPVDLQFGPDGALYVADFYNCIIGHYEVPLTHPKRDRERGRIWRVVYTGKHNASEALAAEPVPDLYDLGVEELFAFLGHPNLTVRVLATNLLTDKYPQEAAKIAGDLLSSMAHVSPSTPMAAKSGAARQASHAIWVLQRTVSLPQETATGLMRASLPQEVQVHLVKALGETAAWQLWHFDAVRTALTNDDAFVRRAAAEALANHPAAENIAPLLRQLQEADPKDAQLIHQIRIAIRNQISSSAIASDVLNLPLSASERRQLVEFAVTAPKGPAAVLIIDEALHGRVSDEALLDALPMAGQYADTERLAALTSNVEQRFSSNPVARFTALEALAIATIQRGAPLDEPLRGRISVLLESAIQGELDIEWHNAPLEGSPASVSPWTRQQRPSKQGGVLEVISSLSEQGERAGGVLRSPEFQLQAHLGFWMCGHNGLPSENDRQLNYVRLVLADGREVARSYPPRDDVARRYEWDLRSHEGQRGRIEVVDGMTDRDGFAWLAVSSFEPSVASLPIRAVGGKDEARLKQIELAGELKLIELQGDVLAVATAVNEAPPTRLAATRALAAFDAALAVAPLSGILLDSNLPMPARAAAADQLGQLSTDQARRSLLAALPSAPQSLALTIAAHASLQTNSAKAFLELVESGKVSPALLLDPVVQDRLRSCSIPNLDERVGRLTEGLEPADARIASLVAERRAGYLAGDFSAEKGRDVFTKSICASCHRIGGVGSEIGPALDGIGNRGLDRLLEDTRDPNRNVDPAFRSVTILTDEGRAFSGFGVREEGKPLAFHDANGKEHRVFADQIIEKVSTSLSPMPRNVADQMPAEDYYALLAYLLSLK